MMNSPKKRTGLKFFIEETETGYGAWAEGTAEGYNVGTSGRTLKEVGENLQDAVQLYRAARAGDLKKKSAKSPAQKGAA